MDLVDVTELVRNIVDNIDKSISGTDSGTIGKLNFCQTKWARTGKNIEGASTDYLITDFQNIEWISAEPTQVGQPQFEPGTYYLPTPFYITGTKWATNREWTIADNDLGKKTPIIWLIETITERIMGRENSIEREMDLRLFFLDETNVTDFYTEDHRREVTIPMQNLAESFVESVRQNPIYDNLDPYTIKTFSRFGVETDQGVFQNVLDANLSGVELNITLKKFKENCKC